MKQNLTVAGKLRCRNSGQVEIGMNVKINGGPRRNFVGGDRATSIWVCRGALLKIGDNTGISGSTIVAAEKVEVGSRVLIGGGCQIFDTDFHPLKGDRGVLEAIKTKPIKIDDDVFIGASCIILKGTTIGRGAVIGAGSVVTENVPPYEIWAGAPACFKKSLR